MVPRVKNLDVVPNPLPPDLRDIELGQAPAVPTSNRRLLMGMGRLVPFKRFDALIQAFAALASDYPDWDLAIWGEGPQRDELIQQIQETGLARSEERRVGKECVSRCRPRRLPYHKKKK